MATRSPTRSAAPHHALIVAIGALSGCSHMHVDASGWRQIVGFVVLTLPPVDAATLGAETIRSRSFGLALTRSPVGDAFVLGYSDASLTAVRNHSLVPAGDALRPNPATAASSARVMFFGTGTTIGLKVGFAEGTVAPTSFTLGFKRKEMSVIPVEPGRPFTSALASLNNSVDVPASAASAASSPSLGVLQYFATGHAAEAIARRDFIQHAFADAAVKTVSGITAFRSGEAAQGKLALDTLACLASVPDAQLDRVWADAERSRVFATSGISGTIDRIRAAPLRADQRRIYTGDLGLLNADSVEHTQAMRIHQAVVCEIARA